MRNIYLYLPRCLYFFTGIFLYSFPFFSVIQKSFIVCFNEPIAYRFFYSLRLIGNYKDTHAWLPQGQLTSSLQHVGLFFATNFGKNLPTLDINNLSLEISKFCLIFYSVVILLVSIILIWVTWSSNFKWTDRILILVGFVAPLYAGSNFFIVPDYLLLNAFFIGTNLCLFIYLWRREDVKNLKFLELFLIGCYFGLLSANKITLLLSTFPIAFFIFLRENSICSIKRERIVPVSLGFLLSMFYVFYTYNWFNFSRTKETFFVWFSFIQNPGDPGSYADRYHHLLASLCQQLYAICIVSSILLLTIYQFFKKKWTGKKRICVFSFFVSIVVGIYLIHQRTFGWTIPDTLLMLFGISLCMLILNEDKIYTRFVFFTSILSLIYIILLGSFQLSRNEFSLEKRIEKEFLVSSQKIKFSGNKRDIYFILPDNRYAIASYFSLFQKGFSETPTWNISPFCQKLMDQFIPRLHFYHEGMGPPYVPEKLPLNTCIAWYDFEGVEPILEKYPQLKVVEDKVKKTYLPLSKVTEYILLT